MPDPRERFIELALRPLAGQSPAEDLARGELMERLNHSRPAPGDDSLETATARLEASPALWRRTGKPAFLLLLAFTLVLGAVAWASWRDLVRIDVFYNILPDTDSLGPAERELEGKVAEDQRLFLFANSNSMGETLRDAWRESCETTLPDDPAWLEEYAVASGFGDRPVRERILEQARRIDPGNGLWDLREAGALLARSKFKYSESRPRSTGMGPVFPMLTTDSDYEKAVALMEKAAAAPRFETRIPPRTKTRLEMLGPATDLAELADRIMFVRLQNGPGSYLSRWAEFWVTRARELEKSQDREGLRRWFATFERLQSRLMKESGDPRLYNPGGFVGSRASRDFQEILRRFDLNDEADRLDHWARELRKPPPTFTTDDPHEVHRRLASFDREGWYSTAGFNSENEFEPGRRAGHAVADRMFAVSAAILFGLLAWLAGLEGWRRVKPIRGLADGVGALLRPRDFAWICGLGIALPAAWHVAVAGISPLGCRDFTISYEDLKPISLRAGGSVIFSICMLVQSARWRLAKRGGLLGFRPRLWQGWVMAATAALFVPAMGAVRYLKPDWQEDYVNYGSAAAGLPLLWLLWRSFALILCPRRAALPGVLVCRMLVPCFIVAGLLLLGAAPLLKREESKWIQRDPLGHPDPGGGGTSVVDARLVNAWRNRLLHAIETAPPTK